MGNIFVVVFSVFYHGQAVARELWASQADLEALTGAPAKKPKESIRYVDRCHLGNKQKRPWKQPSYIFISSCLFCGFSLHFACNLLFLVSQNRNTRVV